VEFPWSDVGTWASLARELGVTQNASRVISGTALSFDSPGNLVAGAERPVVLLGVRGLAVIDAGDALLIADMEKSADVRNVVASLRRRRRDLI
jgi:mannose-1-phosphate guanylyltransferase